MKFRILAFAAATAVMFTSANAQQAADDHLGTVHFPISCNALQDKFDRAVALLHNFFYPETAKAFQAIIKEDPSCAMAYWGLAMSELPNPLVPPFPPANLKAGAEAIQQGKAATIQTPREAEYLAAIEVFYTDYDKIDHKTRAARYEQAMQHLHEHQPEDTEAAIFYALALNGAVDFDDKNYTKQLKAAAILNEEGKKQPNHPGIAHYLIHSYDFAPLASMCVPTAQLYGKIAPNAFHALHMPSHIYSMLGMWEDSVHSNLASKTSADDYEAKNFPDTTHPGVPHMSDFLVYAELQMARDGDAKQLVESLPKLKKFRFASLGIDDGRFLRLRVADQINKILHRPQRQLFEIKRLHQLVEQVFFAFAGKLRELTTQSSLFDPVIEERTRVILRDVYMRGDMALSKRILDAAFPDSRLHAEANLLIMPNLDAANITYNVLKTVAGEGVTVGPILLGAAKPVHILTSTSTARGIVNMTALASVDASIKS